MTRPITPCHACGTHTADGYRTWVQTAPGTRVVQVWLCVPCFEDHLRREQREDAGHPERRGRSGSP